MLRRSLAKKAYRIIAVHLAFWVAFLIYRGIDDRHRSESIYFSLDGEDLTDMVIAMIVVYTNLYVLMPLFYAKQKMVQYLSALVALLLFGGFINRFLSWLVWLPLERLHDPASDEPVGFWIWTRIFGNAFEYFPVLAISVLIKLMFDANAREKKLRALEKEKFGAEMALLKAQINPHFLFNTLNSLYSLSLALSEKSAPMVLRLSGLMRYMLEETGAATVPLQEEITYLENYVSIEQMRYSERLDLSFQYSGEITGKRIMPLLLLPFVENAFKHGIEDSAGWITIDLKVVGQNLYLKVENSYTPSSKVKPPGLGLSNARKRLALAYPDRHKLDIGQNENIYSAELTLGL